MTYDNEIYLTFDTGWAEDEVVQDTLPLLDAHGATTTMFVPHGPPALAALAGHPRIEVGIHPNFNALLDTGPHDHDAASIDVTIDTRVGEVMSWMEIIAGTNDPGPAPSEPFAREARASRVEWVILDSRL